MLRPLGRTGLTVTPIGLGLAALGRPSYITSGRAHDLGEERSPEALEQRSHAVLSAAYSAGVRYFDVARSYGDGERFLASWLRASKIAADGVTVGSKWGYTYVGGWRLDAAVHEVKDHSLAALRRQLEQSRALLGPFLDLYQVHSATLESGILDDRRVLEALSGLRASGLAIGVTVSGPGQAEVIRRALEVSVGGINPFQCVQATWNLLEPSAGAALAEASSAGWGVIIKEALANGRLAGKDQLAIAAALANPWVDVVLSGAVTPEQVASNVAAIGMVSSVPEALDRFAISESPEQYWRERAERAWS